MKHEEPENINYAATVVKLKGIRDVGLNTLNAVNVMNYQALIDKSHGEGELGILFTAETRLSEEFCRVNNLHRHGTLNADPGVTGYMEDNRRVRAVKLGGQRSDAFWLPLKAVEYTGVKRGDLKEGDIFDHLKGHLICEKHKVDRAQKNVVGQVLPNRVDEKHFPQHFDTVNYFRNSFLIPDDTDIVVTQKTHGTSLRVAHTLVERKLSLREKIAKFFGAKVQLTEHAMIYGSRTQTKDANMPVLSKYFEKDVWAEAGHLFDGSLPENWIVYAEIVGWSGGKPVQKGYTYELPEGTFHVQVYRISTINSRGITVDLSWDALKEFCRNNGFDHVAELWRGKHGDFDVQKFMDARYHESGYTQALPLGPTTKKNPLVDEGVCVRLEGITPMILKAKSPLFLGFETKMLDEGELDLESAEADPVEAVPAS